MKPLRQSAILEIIQRDVVTTQERLRRRLKARGFDVTQATLSRDIKELALVKRSADGAYQRPGSFAAAPTDPEAGLRRAVADYLRRIRRVQQFVLVQTNPGYAQPLAVTIDRTDLSEVAGTIGGDDTVLVICYDADRAKALAKRFEEWAK